jgi:hypothetical protein
MKFIQGICNRYGGSLGWIVDSQSWEGALAGNENGSL